MAPYYFIDFEYFVFMVGVGLIITLLIILARSSFAMSFTLKSRSDRELEEDVHEFGGGVTECYRPLPLLMIVVFFGYFVWAAGYVIYISFAGF